MTSNNTLKPRLNLLTTRWAALLLSAFGLVAIWMLLNLVIGGKCEQKCVTDTLSQTLRVVTPIAFAALCGVMCERSGIFNIGIEGQMLMAAMVGYAVNLFTYQWLKGSLGIETAANLSRFLALILGVLSGVLMAWIHALISIKFKVDQIISGTVINILAIGITGFVYRQFLSQNLPPGPGTYPLISIPLLSQIPFIGPILFIQKPLTYIMLLAVIFVHYMLFHTPWGLRTRAIGEHPRAADTLGVDVIRMQYINVLWGGALAGLGGLWFTLEAVDVFNPMMTNGLGFIGLAAMIFGKYTPFGALAGALIFGLGSSVTATISIFRPDIPSQFPQMLPYVLTIIILSGVVGKAKPPAAGGKVYEKQ